MPKVAVTYPWSETNLAPLKDRAELVVCSLEDRKLGKLAEKCAGADAVISLLTDKIDADFLNAVGPQLGCVAQVAVGFDNVDREEVLKRGIAVTNTPGALSAQAIAEHAIGITLHLLRHIAAADALVRAGEYKGWDPMLMLGSELHGKTVGVVGAGATGAAVAMAAHNGFGARILYTDHHRNSHLEKHLGALQVPLRKLLERSDVVSLHVPLLKETHHLIGAEELGHMKKTAILLNLARGPVVDEKAVVKALRDKMIAGAGLDVYENEPQLAAGLTDLPNVVLTPHTASATQESRAAMVAAAVRNVLAHLSGNQLPNRIL
jgi:glyoxylate reductase